MKPALRLARNALALLLFVVVDVVGMLAGFGLILFAAEILRP